MSKDKSKLVHDMNSSISSVTQAIDLIGENWKDNPELVEKMLPLTQKKMIELFNDWTELKNIILEQG
ncbi:hypothetical protein [Halobacteriovorax sp. HLS]|uniref:hypothetical protein n=1 Tax=Halobacteriovorax sp. HLS TaxID=2234000 RepID=UPI000FD9A01E|nr:hypothetical protein [Halobacteriovorax sp. HLS]